MTSATRRGLILALAHVALVASAGGKLLADRARYPRVWVETAPVDPRLPIRGRYVRLRIDAVPGAGLNLPEADGRPAVPGRTRAVPQPTVPVRLAVEQDALVAHDADGAHGQLARARSKDGVTVAEIVEPLAFFIPPDISDPSRRQPGEALWVEVTVPPTGPPRPIRLGVKREGVLTPLDMK